MGVFHSPGISAKLFSKKGRKMAATLASLLVIASLAAAKPQVGFGFPSSSSSLTPLEQRVPNTCTTLSGSTCVFPFVFNGATHFQCTYSDSPTPWCATAVDGNNEVVTNGWGDCAVSATSAWSTTLAPLLDKPRPGAQRPPLAQAPTLTGSMVSARPPAHRTRPPQPPQPPQQPQPQPQQLPQQPQRRPRPAALQAHSPPSTATPASATPSDSTSA